MMTAGLTVLYQTRNDIPKKIFLIFLTTKLIVIWWKKTSL